MTTREGTAVDTGRSVPATASAVVAGRDGDEEDGQGTT
jgi:hypothetical protein